MSFTPFVPPLAPVASTGVAGFTKVNGTPNIITWTAPNDGAIHRFLIIASETVTATETGGAVSSTHTAPGGGVQAGVGNIFAGGKAAGTAHQLDGATCQAGSTVTVQQTTALTAGGPTVVWAEIWAA